MIIIAYDASKVAGAANIHIAALEYLKPMLEDAILGTAYDPASGSAIPDHEDVFPKARHLTVRGKNNILKKLEEVVFPDIQGHVSGG